MPNASTWITLKTHRSDISAEYDKFKMNLMRKLVHTSTPASSGDNSLGLTHLRKLFADFRQPAPGVTQEALEAKLYNTLPLFCKVFGSAPSSDMLEKFPDILQFCSHVSRLMVSEIRRRASNQSTDAASCAIVSFLEIESTEDRSPGWMLLSAINLLCAGGGSGLVDCMTAASLPSTLVKCLYLLFDLPDLPPDPPPDGSQFTAHERRVLLQKLFVQVLVRMTSYVSPAEELVRRDDLTLLFSAITSWCPAHNIPWRKSAAEVLMTLSRHGLTPSVVQYIHDKGCVAMCIDNMRRVQELSPIELVEMFVSVFCFLKDSSEVSQVLLDDFRSYQGYSFLSEFLLRMEQDRSEEAMQALRNLVLLVGSLTSCGYTELRPTTASAGSLFQMPGFCLPQPTGKGVSVRNLQAFEVLQTVFLKAMSTQLCNTILDVMSSLYHQDNANYFILEPQNTLSQFSEKIHTKAPEIQSKFFEILEFIVFNLNFVPCKELIGMSILIKTNHSIDCSLRCMKTLVNVLQYNLIYKDAFREVGLMEVMAKCLSRFADALKAQNAEKRQMSDAEREMGFLVMEGLTIILSGNNSNAGVFRECGGARCAHALISEPSCRTEALAILQQLIMSNSGDEDMASLLALMHTSPTSALELKLQVLQALLSVLRESHRSRMVFRKVGGFVYVLSVLVSMEGCFADPPKAPWDTATQSDVIGLLQTVFHTLTVAMRYEPANARLFATEVRYDSLTEAVRLLGCFSTETLFQAIPSNLRLRTSAAHFENLFWHQDEKSLRHHLPKTLVHCCRALRYLFDMAVDSYDKPAVAAPCASPRSVRRMWSLLEPPDGTDCLAVCHVPKRASTGSLPSPPPPEVPTRQPSMIVHPGALISLLHLLPAISCSEQQMSASLQLVICEVLKSELRSERNQQVMCDAGLPNQLLTRCHVTLADEKHPFHQPMQYIFERLAAHSLTPRDLRNFLRLGSPLCCAADSDADNHLCMPAIPASQHQEASSLDDVCRKLETNGGAVPLTRVKCLVSMTTPRDVRLHGATVTPAFIEFDMRHEGFGCLYLPSVAPHAMAAPSVVSSGIMSANETAVVGGIGSGERLFPPQSGITYCSWFCVDKFTATRTHGGQNGDEAGGDGPHPVRLLSLVRTAQGREDSFICLSVFLSSTDHSLFISTQETQMPISGGADLHQEPILNEKTVRLRCAPLAEEGQWRHLVLVLNKAGMLKNSSVSVYVDGVHYNTQKLHYISPNVGGAGTGGATSVFAFIGSPPQLRRPSSLVWRQGPCHLIEDVLSASGVLAIHQLGPNYVGSFQAPDCDADMCLPLVSEEKIMFSIHAHALSLMTIAKIRKVYNSADAKSIAKQLGMSARENATPIRILHNSASHLSGPACCFGAVLMGYIGVRTFCPKPVAKIILNVGGTSAMLGLVAMATDVEGLYAAVKALVCVVRSNEAAVREMARVKGYQTLSMLLHKKKHLLNSHILHLTFSLVGTVDSGRETTIIPNRTAFEDLLLELQVWHEAPGDLQRSLYEHFLELLTESSDQQNNVRFMQHLGLVGRLTHVMREPGLSSSSLHVISNVITVLLLGATHSPSLLRFGQFMVSLIPPCSFSERCISLDADDASRTSPGNDDDTTNATYRIRLRNMCLDIIQRLLSAQPSHNGVNQHTCDEIQRVLGFDWLLLFLQGQLHVSTVVTAMRILITMLGTPSTLQKFKDGSSSKGWLSKTHLVLNNHIGSVLGLDVSGTSLATRREINPDVCQLSGFMALQWLLPRHADVSQLYLLLMSFLLGQPVRDLPAKLQQFDLDMMWTFTFGVPVSQPLTSMDKRPPKGELNMEAAIVILSMIRSTLNQQWEAEEEGSWCREYPVTLMQFFLFLYHNQPDFVIVCMSTDLLCALVATLFPYPAQHMSPGEDFKPFPGAEETMVFVKMTQRQTSSSSLSTHPARKFVMDFLRMILIDSLSLPLSGRTVSPIDIVLEASPENATAAQSHEFQTEIIKSLMDHLDAVDVLLGDQATLPLVTGGSYANIATNVFNFANRVVDKLWQGVYQRESKEVFTFVSTLISQAKRKASGLTLDGAYRSLNRVVLHQLSRPIRCITDQTNLLDALHCITANRALVFGPGNFSSEFIGCLCYCLLQITEDPNKLTDPPLARMTTWHVDTDVTETDSMMDVTPASGLQPLAMLTTATERVWDELYISKKPVIEELFKVTLMGTETVSLQITTPELSTVRSSIQEAACRVWVNYFENERKCSTNYVERIPSQLHSKLQKVGHGVMRLATRKPRKELPVKQSTLTEQEFFTWTASHMSIVKDLVEFQYKQHLQNAQHKQRYLLEEWGQTETELMQERGIWGPPIGTELDKWLLDMTEGPYRMRKKLRRNDMFYVHYSYFKEGPSDVVKVRNTARSLDSKRYYEQFRSRSLVSDDHYRPITAEQPESDDDVTTENKTDDASLPAPTLLPRLLPTTGQQGTEAEEECEIETTMVESTGDGESQMLANNQTLIRLLEEGEKISQMFRCARIEGLDTVEGLEGLLLFGREHFYVVDGLTLLRSKEIADIDSLPADMHEPIIPKVNKDNVPQRRRCIKFAFEDIREVHKRRYLLQHIAIEVFSVDGRNFLLAFPRSLRDRIYTKFLTVATAITDSAQESVSGQKQSAKVEPATSLISSIIGEKSVTERWVRGEICNFEYLMCLNTLAGRSYNDLMQYLVFPWIIADYDQEELDLTNPATFRDLSKPMGAQTPNRLLQYKKRYKDWDDPQGETPPYHYGTHYSSAMIVASYLIRMEPFAQYFLRLQGGHFDLADRMFHSVKDAWKSASQYNMADVKELIPEFFYLPEMFLNTNNFDLGIKQSGVPLGDIILPRWAKGDAREFVRAHREALECDYVSCHLNEWIDLIFGYKQVGPAAVEAVNVFHHLFYEGNVDIYSIDDPLKKNATIGFINNFGQIPKQLFKKPHPQKRLNIRNLDPISFGPLLSAVSNNSDHQLFFHNLDNLQPTMQPAKELKGAVGFILATDKMLLAVEQNKVLMPPTYTKHLAWGFSDMSIRIGNYDSDKTTSVFENLDTGEILCAACPNARTIITAGTSTVVTIWELGCSRGDKRRLTLRQPLYGHTDTVTCLAASSSYNVVVSGSRDRTCIVWDLSRRLFVRQLRRHAAPVAAVCVNDLTGDIATCAGTYLHVWNINGAEIASINTATGSNQQILCVTMSQIKEWDARNVIMTGNSDGVVRMWSLEFVEVADTPVTKSDCVVSSTADKLDDVSTVTQTSEFRQLETSDDIGGADSRLLEQLREQLDLKQHCSAETTKNAQTDIAQTVEQTTTNETSKSSQESVTQPPAGFEVVAEAEVMSAMKDAAASVAPPARRSANHLRAGFHWQRQLVFCSKLTMHTAFERKDNKDPAAVTALSISKDHRSVYVGDARGRVYSWSVTDQPGCVAADHWVKDDGADSCNACSVRFSFSERRHHCRNCGQVFCAKCSRYEMEIRRLQITKPVRVCQPCYMTLQADGATRAASSSRHEPSRSV